MQLELPFPVEPRGRDDLGGPIRPPPGRLRRVHLSGRVIPYWFRRARRRAISIVVDQRGLTVSAPRWATVAEAEAFVQEKERWILRCLDEQGRDRRAPFAWRDGARLPYLGRTVALACITGGTTRLAGDRLQVPAIEFESGRRLRDAVLGWLRSSALAFYRERVTVFATAMGVLLPEVGLSNAASQWGSCTKGRDRGARVLLHWKLVHFEPPLIDYVVAHELAHLRHMNHSTAFWRVVHSVYPKHQWARRELREREQLIPNL